MANVLLARIDERLMHGQIGSQWTKSLGANLLLIANDAVAADSFKQGIMNMAAPSGVATRFFSLQKTIDIIDKASADQKIFIIVENPQDALTLIEGGVPIKKVNIGNMAMSSGKRQVGSSVAVDDADVEVFRKMKDLGVELIIQRVPSSDIEDLGKLGL
jgi:PTS system N-acetylgalactosamine-specific IIB component